MMKSRNYVYKSALLVILLLAGLGLAQDRGIIGINYTPTQWGARITSVTPGGPAAKAGLKPGDIITAVDRYSLAGATQQQMSNLIGGTVGSAAIFTISNRAGRYQKAIARVSSRTSSVSSKRGIIGISYKSHPFGAILTKIVPGSPAAKAGLKVGEIISKANNTSLAGLNAQQISAIIGGTAGSTITLTVNNARGAYQRTLVRARASSSTPGSTGLVGISWKLSQWGAFITSVTPGGPAAKAGIHNGDTITAVNNTSLRGMTVPQIKNLIGGPAGSTVTFNIANTTGQYQKTLIRAKAATRSSPHTPAKRPNGLIGITYKAVQAGMLITAVTPNSPAANAGVQANDILTAINGTSIVGVSQQQASFMLNGPAGTRFVLTFATRSGTRTITIVKQSR